MAGAFCSPSRATPASWRLPDKGLGTLWDARSARAASQSYRTSYSGARPGCTTMEGRRRCRGKCSGACGDDCRCDCCADASSRSRVQSDADWTPQDWTTRRHEAKLWARHRESSGDGMFGDQFLEMGTETRSGVPGEGGSEEPPCKPAKCEIGGKTGYVPAGPGAPLMLIPPGGTICRTPFCDDCEPCPGPPTCCCPTRIAIKRASVLFGVDKLGRPEPEPLTREEDGVKWHGFPLQYEVDWEYRDGEGGECQWEKFEAGWGKRPEGYRFWKPWQWNSTNAQYTDPHNNMPYSEPARFVGMQNQGETRLGTKDFPSTTNPSGRSHSHLQFVRVTPGCKGCEPCCLFVFVVSSAWPWQVWARAHCGAACDKVPPIRQGSGGLSASFFEGAPWYDPSQLGEPGWIPPTNSSTWRWVSSERR